MNEAESLWPDYRVADMLAAHDALASAEVQIYGPQVDLLECPLVVNDERQYARAVAVGLGGRVADMRFENALFDGPRFRLAKRCEDQRGAETAFLFPAGDALGEVVDVVAWVPETGRAATLAGEIGTLGLWSISGVQIAPPIVHESLLAWFLSDDGLFLLDEALAVGELAGQVLAASDRAAALRIHARLAPHARKPPQIVVPRSDVRRAS